MGEPYRVPLRLEDAARALKDDVPALLRSLADQVESGRLIMRTATIERSDFCIDVAIRAYVRNTVAEPATPLP